jgi:hypothetical protein
VFGYGRKPEYFRWTTTMERQLYSAAPEPPQVPDGFAKSQQAAGKKQGAGEEGQFAQFAKAPALDPTGKPITVEAWMTATAPNGVIVARGGPVDGFALSLETGKPVFQVRSANQLFTVTGSKRIVGGWHHVVGVLGADRTLKLYVDGELVGEGQAAAFVSKDPAQGLEIGNDAGSTVGENTVTQFVGIIDEVRLYFAETDAATVAARYTDAAEMHPDPVLVVSFDDGTARDMSLHRNNGTISGGRPAEGRFGQGLQLSARRPNAAKTKSAGVPAAGGDRNSLIEPRWNKDVPIYVRAMVLSGSRLFIAGPPDLIDEEATFQQLAQKDESVESLLAAQADAIDGRQGGKLLAVNADTGEIERSLELDSLPSWDGLAAARGQLLMTTLDGRVICFAP